MDRGILAQQSDVRCKGGWLGVILIAPAAYTSKGLAKAFVSRTGGKGPENRDTPASLSPTLRGARVPLKSTGLRSKTQGLQLTALGYSGVSRPRLGLWLRSDEVDPIRLTLLPRWGLLWWEAEARGCPLTSSEGTDKGIIIP
jgi:hypothetical protein